jgi:phenylpropionate dioxygenase-like ring-hydroxylating dioxygenase large terminal subunit
MSRMPTDARARDLHIWPRYERAALGFREYWYPATWSREIHRQPLSLKLLGEPVMLYRERGRLHAFYDQCPHRGIPLSVGRQEFPGTWTCRYHGWTYDLDSGELRAALTDGPDSPICGKVRVKTYPVEERAGIVWIWMGNEAPGPVEDDIPAEMLRPNTVIVGRIGVFPGNWRLAAENGYDEGHLVYLHRYGALRTLFRDMPGWLITRSGGKVNGAWLARTADEIGPGAEYPGLGRWPRRKPWQRSRSWAQVAICLPCTLQVRMPHYTTYTWYEAVDEEHYRRFSFHMVQATGLKAFLYKLKHHVYGWYLHDQFTAQDERMVRLMPMSGPERLYRPDASITAWRRLCEHARGAETADAPPDADRALGCYAFNG